jgi:hypothetical protein
MNTWKHREQWLQDVQDRQRNIVFPQMLANETRLWRNIGRRPATALTWIGLAILGLSVLGFMGYLLVIWIQAGTFWAEVLTILMIFGPIFGLIAWAARRSLRSLENSRHRSRGEILVGSR